MEKNKNFFGKLGDFFIPNSKDSQKRKIQKIVSIIAVVVLIAGIVTTILVINKYKAAGDNTDTYSDLLPSSTDSSSDDSLSSVDANTVPVDPPAPRDPETGVIEELSEMYKVNNDLIGFLNIPDTKLRYPVTQGEDSKYYLDHTLYKEYNAFGVPFLDHRATVIDGFESAFLTIYGHSAKDGTFFAAVKEYKDFEFYKKHPIVEFDTIYNKGKYKVMGFFMEDVRRDNLKRFGYHDYIDKASDDEASDKYVQDYIDNVLSRSYFDTTVDVNPDDQFIALSTCDTEVNNTDYRVVLVARKVRPGESTEVDVAGAKINEDVKMPEGWIKKKGKDSPHK